MFRPKLSSKPVAGALIAACAILLLEMVLRVGTFVWYDFSQYYLFYGFQNLVGRVGITPWHSDGRHYKFPPNYLLRGAAGQAGETAAINSLGFRGPEFQRTKPAGTFRVICLGESSTFGFHNSDTETYPFLLEQLFRERPSPVKVEVINAGFPYYNSGSILSLVREEILSLEPDLLTIYSAYNDPGWPLRAGPVRRFASWLHAHSMVYLLMKESIFRDRFVLTAERVNRKSFETHTSQVVARYRSNYEALISAARSKGIPIILIKQPMTARYTHIQERQYARSYEAEYESVLKKLEANRKLSSVEYQLLVHHRLVDELEAIAKREHVDLVDNIAIVDQDRRLMASYVHLTAEANLNLAKALKPVIERYLPTQAHVPSHNGALKNSP